MYGIHDRDRSWYKRWVSQRNGTQLALIYTREITVLADMYVVEVNTI